MSSKAESPSDGLATFEKLRGQVVEGPECKTCEDYRYIIVFNKWRHHCPDCNPTGDKEWRRG